MIQAGRHGAPAGTDERSDSMKDGSAFGVRVKALILKTPMIRAERQKGEHCQNKKARPDPITTDPITRISSYRMILNIRAVYL
jgi:hypothetical protein